MPKHRNKKVRTKRQRFQGGGSAIKPPKVKQPVYASEALQSVGSDGWMFGPYGAHTHVHDTHRHAEYEDVESGPAQPLYDITGAPLVENVNAPGNYMPFDYENSPIGLTRAHQRGGKTKTLGACSAEQLKRGCKNISMGVGLECRCPKVEKPSSNRQGGKVSGVQRFKSGGRVGRSRLGHPIKKR